MEIMESMEIMEIMESMEIMEIMESMESVVRTPGDALNQSVPAPSGGDKIIEIPLHLCTVPRGGLVRIGPVRAPQRWALS